MKIEELIKNNKATLVDVRTVEEFEEVCIPGSVNIPLHTIPLCVDQFKSMPQPIILFCRSGARSYQASSWLKHHGIETHDGGGISQIISVLGLE